MIVLVVASDVNYLVQACWAIVAWFGHLFEVVKGKILALISILKNGF